jgi:TonB family protein
MPLRLLATYVFLTCVLTLAAAQVSPSQRVRVSQGVEQGLILTKVDPIYPPLARRARIQGTVILRVVINKSGDVENMQLFSGHPMLAQAALDAVKQWKYKPYLLNGAPVEVETTVMVNFTLPEMRPSQGVVGDAPGGILPDAPSALRSISPVDADRPGVVRVAQGEMAELLTSKVPPEYPAVPKRARIQGTVVLRVDIDKEGNVSNIQLISGHPLLAPAAIDAVKQWKYKPYLLNGAPVEVETQVRVNFTCSKTECNDGGL